VVRALDRRGKPFEMSLKNFGQVVQHETDHLDGVLFLDRGVAPVALVPRRVQR
jgi:peptide deformylase